MIKFNNNYFINLFYDKIIFLIVKSITYFIFFILKSLINGLIKFKKFFFKFINILNYNIILYINQKILFYNKLFYSLEEGLLFSSSSFSIYWLSSFSLFKIPLSFKLIFSCSSIFFLFLISFNLLLLVSLL